MNLLDRRGRVSPKDSKTHVRIPFQLIRSCGRLNIRLEYSPKTLDDREQTLALLKRSFDLYLLPEQKERAAAQADQFMPLKNLITLSLDDPQGYRGACHRQDAVQHVYVTDQKASPGLMPGKLESGPWQVTLSLHCIVTETCDYRLQIWTEEEPR